jgi:hypothetical protein
MTGMVVAAVVREGSGSDRAVRRKAMVRSEQFSGILL